MMDEKKNHLPMFGVGPIYVAVIIALTVAGILLAAYVLPSGRFDVLWIPFICVGVLLIVFGGSLWKSAVLKERIDDGIRENKLVKTGVYAIVRNPIYSAFMLACTADSKQSVVIDPAARLLAIFDGADEKHRRKMVERTVRKRV